MGLSVQDYVGDGIDKAYALNFTLGYRVESDVTCRVNNEVDGGDDPIYRVITYTPGNPNLVTIGGAIPGVGEPIRFQRTVSKAELLYDFQKRDALDEKSLDESHTQLMHAMHELLDGFGLTAPLEDLDMGGNRIIGLPSEPTAEDEAVSKSWLEGDFTDALTATIDAAVTAAEEAQTGSELAEAGALTSETNAGLSETNAEDWATKVDGIVEATDYSSKAHAVGGIGVTSISGASKEWATKAEDSLVDGSEYSALHYATKAAALVGSLTEDSFFDFDANLDLMPAVNPIYSPHYELDGNLDLQPIA